MSASNETIIITRVRSLCLINHTHQHGQQRDVTRTLPKVGTICCPFCVHHSPCDSSLCERLNVRQQPWGSGDLVTWPSSLQSLSLLCGIINIFIYQVCRLCGSSL